MTSADPNAAPAGFAITVEDGQPVPRVVVTGELDLLTSPRLQEILFPLIDQAQDGQVLVDLIRVSFFDSSALNVLLRAQRRAGEQRCALSVAASPAVERVIELTGVAEHLTLAK